MTTIEPTDEMVKAAAEVAEDEMIRHLGRDLGTIHRDDIVRAILAAGLVSATALPEVEITDRLIVVFEEAYDLPGIAGGNTRAGLRAAFEAAGIRVKETGE